MLGDWNSPRLARLGAVFGRAHANASLVGGAAGIDRREILFALRHCGRDHAFAVRGIRDRRSYGLKRSPRSPQSLGRSASPANRLAFMAIDRNIPWTFPTGTLRRSDRCRTPGDPIEEHSPRGLRGSACEVGANRRGAGSGDTCTRASARLHHQRHVHCVWDSLINSNVIVCRPTDGRFTVIN